MYYTDIEELKITKRLGITTEVFDLLQKEKERLKTEEKRYVSMAKIVCNLVLKEYAVRHLLP